MQRSKYRLLGMLLSLDRNKALFEEYAKRKK